MPLASPQSIACSAIAWLASLTSGAGRARLRAREPLCSYNRFASQCCAHSAQGGLLWSPSLHRRPLFKSLIPKEESSGLCPIFPMSACWPCSAGCGWRANSPIKSSRLQRQGRATTFGSLVGQEATAVGLAAPLQPQDWLATSYREIASLIVKGVPLATHGLLVSRHDAAPTGPLNRAACPTRS